MKLSIVLFSQFLFVIFTLSSLFFAVVADDLPLPLNSVMESTGILSDNSDFIIPFNAKEQDWATTDWDTIDFSRDDIYISDDFYKNIPLEYYAKIDYTKVDYKKIDQSKISSAKFLNDFNCLECSLTGDGPPQIKFDKGKISHKTGDKVSVSQYPVAAHFDASSDYGLIVVLPDNLGKDSERSLPNYFFDLGNLKEDKALIGFKKEGIVNYNGLTIESEGGMIRVDRDKVFISSKATPPDLREFVSWIGVKVNGVDVTPDMLTPDSDMQIFSNSLHHPGIKNYIAFSNSALVIKSVDSAYVTFDKANPYFRMEGEDTFKLKLINYELEIEKLENNDRIPSLNLKPLGNSGSLILETGKIVMDASPGKAVQGQIKRDTDATSVAMRINNRPSSLGFIISHFNEFGYDHGKGVGHKTLVQAADVYHPDLALPKEFSESLKFNYNTFTPEFFKVQYPEIRLSGDLSASNLKKLSYALGELPDNVRESVRGVRLFDDSKWDSHISSVYRDGFHAGAYTSSDRIIRVPERGLSKAAIFHEAAHDYVYKVTREDQAQTLRANMDNHQPLPVFVDQWKILAGEYGIGLGEKKDGLAVVWADGSTVARNGFASPYGANNLQEDVATLVQLAVNKPKEYQSLLKVDTRFKQKLDLLHARKFIDNKHYVAIVGSVNVGVVR